MWKFRYRVDVGIGNVDDVERVLHIAVKSLISDLTHAEQGVKFRYLKTLTSEFNRVEGRVSYYITSFADSLIELYLSVRKPRESEIQQYSLELSIETYIYCEKAWFVLNVIEAVRNAIVKLRSEFGEGAKIFITYEELADAFDIHAERIANAIPPE